MTASGLDKARAKAFRVVYLQVGVTLVATAAAGWFLGTKAGYSALLGGGIGALMGLVTALQMFGLSSSVAPRVLVQRAYMSMIVRLILAVVLFSLVFALVEVAPLVLFAAFAATASMYWFSLY